MSKAVFMMDCVAELEENTEVGQEDITPVEGKPEISLCAVNGIVLPETMRLVGPRIIVLIDSGSKQNFISNYVVQLLQLPQENLKDFQVKVASGEHIVSTGICGQVPHPGM